MCPSMWLTGTSGISQTFDKAVAKLIKATSLWTHKDAESWLVQIKAQLGNLNKNVLPHRGTGDKSKKETQDAFYNTMSNIARLLRDVYSDDAAAKQFLQGFAHRDLNLRGCEADAEINQKLVGVVEGARGTPVTPDQYLQYRLHSLATLIKIKMQIHDEETLGQLEDVLLWGMHGSYTVEVFRYALKAIADSKLNDAKINEHLLSFLGKMKRQCMVKLRSYPTVARLLGKLRFF